MIKALFDIDVILDNYDNQRRHSFPDSVEVFEIATKNPKRGVFFISSSSLDNIAFIKNRDLRLAHPYLTFAQRVKIINKLLQELFSIFNLCKTPSYLSLGDDIDIEDVLLISSAKAFDLKLITRREKLLRKFPEIAVTPRQYLEKIQGTFPERIPLLDIKAQTLYVYSEIEREIDEVIGKSEFILGSKVKELEKKISNYIGSKHCIGVASGTDALLLSLRALAIKRKEEEYWSKEDLIITTPFTFTATGDTILRSGATPLFVDIDPNTYNIDVSKIKEALKVYGNRVVGIIPVHLYGLPCDMDEIMEIAAENNLFVVEDCAQAFGSMYKDRKVGSFGDTGAFSFFPSKNLGAFGDAGAITTDDDELAETITMLRVHGGRNKYNVEHIGYKARLDAIQAAILLAKLPHIDEFNTRRREIAKTYMEELKDISGIRLPFIPSADYYHTFHQFTILLENGQRNAIQEYLKGEGVQTMVYYPVPLHKMRIFDGRCEIFGSLENSEKASENVLSLPMGPVMDMVEAREVSTKIRRGFNYEI